MNAALKRTFVFILAVCLSLTLLPAPALALSLTDGADANGSGWIWDSASKTLTLNGATINEEIELPEDSTIVLMQGSTNNLSSSIYCGGDLEITGEGNLNLSMPINNRNTRYTKNYGPLC